MLRLDKDLLHALVTSIKGLIDLRHILEAHAVRHHIEGVDLALLDELHEIFPVFLNGSLSIANETDTRLHQCANVKVIGLTKATSSHDQQMRSEYRSWPCAIGGELTNPA